jgi:hypothetical protein
MEMDFTQYAMATFALIGLINWMNFGFDGNWKSFAKVGIAVVAGSVFGYFQVFGIPSIEIGFALGINSSGVFKGLQVLQGK